MTVPFAAVRYSAVGTKQTWRDKSRCPLSEAKRTCPVVWLRRVGRG
jgi:hypothetical protein